MPIAQLKTNYPFTPDRKQEFLKELSETLSEILHKPLPAVMLMLDECTMYMNHSEETVFFGEFRYILPEAYQGNKAGFLEFFADAMLAVIRKYTQVNPYRIYMQFTEMQRENAWKYTAPEQERN